MTALDDAKRATPLPRASRAAGHRDGPSPLSGPARLDEQPRSAAAARIPGWLPSRRFISAIAAIGGMQLLATMDSTVAIVALPKIQDELGLSDAGRSWVITAYVLTFGGLMLLGDRCEPGLMLFVDLLESGPQCLF